MDEVLMNDDHSMQERKRRKYFHSNKMFIPKQQRQHRNTWTQVLKTA